jgi:putative transposase
MGRALRAVDGGLAYHVLSRANARSLIFASDDDYQAFGRILSDAVERYAMRLLAYCIMPNHWHLVLWPRRDGDLSRFTGWLTLTHRQRWHAFRHSAGTGHVYQGRFKSFPVANDDHLLTVCRYMERNPLRAGLVRKPDGWRWSSLWQRLHGEAKDGALLADWPIPRSRDWLAHVAQPLTSAELEAVRRSVTRGQPFGGQVCTKRIAARLGLEVTLRPRGRPKKTEGTKALSKGS